MLSQSRARSVPGAARRECGQRLAAARIAGTPAPLAATGARRRARTPPRTSAGCVSAYDDSPTLVLAYRIKRRRGAEPVPEPMPEPMPSPADTSASTSVVSKPVESVAQAWARRPRTIPPSWRFPHALPRSSAPSVSVPMADVASLRAQEPAAAPCASVVSAIAAHPLPHVVTCVLPHAVTAVATHPSSDNADAPSAHPSHVLPPLTSASAIPDQLRQSPLVGHINGWAASDIDKLSTDELDDAFAAANASDWSSAFCGISGPGAAMSEVCHALLNKLPETRHFSPPKLKSCTDWNSACQEELKLLHAGQADFCLFGDIAGFMTTKMRALLPAFKRRPHILMQTLEPLVRSLTMLNADLSAWWWVHNQRCPHPKCDRHMASPPCTGFSSSGDRQGHEDVNVIYLMVWFALRIAIQESEVLVENTVAHGGVGIGTLLVSMLGSLYHVDTADLCPSELDWPLRRPRSYFLLRHKSKCGSLIQSMFEFTRRFVAKCEWHWRDFLWLHLLNPATCGNTVIADEMQSDLAWALRRDTSGATRDGRAFDELSLRPEHFGVPRSSGPVDHTGKLLENPSLCALNGMEETHLGKYMAHLLQRGGGCEFNRALTLSQNPDERAVLSWHVHTLGHVTAHTHTHLHIYTYIVF